jgi:flavorubredoxin
MADVKKCLILYQSMTGNTEKVALRFKKAFDKKGWQCDMFKFEKALDIKNPPFDFRDYDFLCAGSGCYGSLPGAFISDFLYKFAHRAGGDRNRKVPRHKKIVPGPKTGVVFVTYAGAHLGPKEAEPALSLLDMEIEHLKFKCIGRFCCPGRMGKAPTPRYWHGDITHRPSERDLQKAEIFMEEIIEEIQ